jgi:hypothetical protein
MNATTKAQRLAKARLELENTLQRVGYSRSKVFSRSVKLVFEPSVKPSVRCSDAIPENGPAKPVSRYTGNEIAGIVVMHKSNLQPVRRDNPQALIDSAQMRR